MLDSSRCSVDDRNANQEAVARMNWRDRISADPAVLVGKPVVRGTRISVELILELLAAGYTTEQVMAPYDQLQVDDVHACLAYAAEIVGSETVIRRPA